MPTWHYEAVEIEGPARRALARTSWSSLLDRLSERDGAAPFARAAWTRAKMAPGKFEAMTQGDRRLRGRPDRNSRHPQVQPAQVRLRTLRRRSPVRRGAGREDIVQRHRRSDSGAMNRLAIFDCDGTLVDSGATIYRRACGDASRQNGLEVPPPEVAGGSSGSAWSRRWPRSLPDASRRAARRSWPRTTSAHFWHAARRGPGRGAAVRRRSRAARRAGSATAGCSRSPPASRTAGSSIASSSTASTRASCRCRPPTGIRPSRTRRWSQQAIADAGAAPETTIVVGDTSFDMGMAARPARPGSAPAGAITRPTELLEAGAVAVAEQPLDVLDLGHGAMSHG